MKSRKKMNRFTVPRFRINTTALIYAWKPLAASSSLHRRINTSDNLLAAMCLTSIFGIVSKKYKSRVFDWNVNSANENRLYSVRAHFVEQRMECKRGNASESRSREEKIISVRHDLLYDFRMNLIQLSTFGIYERRRRSREHNLSIHLCGMSMTCSHWLIYLHSCEGVCSCMHGIICHN